MTDKVGKQTLETMSGAQKYNERLFSLIRPSMSGQVLEVGAGMGTFVEKLRADGFNTSALDINQEYLVLLKRKFKGMKTYCLDLQTKNLPKEMVNKFDTVVMLNVLEHIKDDAKAIQNLYRMMRTGGRLVVIVPAHQWAYGNYDKFLGHHRRYSTTHLIRVMKQGRFKIETARYINPIPLLGWWITGKLLQRKAISSPLVKIADALTPLSGLIEDTVNPQFGLSVLCIGVKP